MFFFERIESKKFFFLFLLVMLIYGGQELRNKSHDTETIDRKSMKSFDSSLIAENQEIMQQVKILDEMHLAVSED